MIVWYDARSGTPVDVNKIVTELTEYKPEWYRSREDAIAKINEYEEDLRSNGVSESLHIGDTVYYPSQVAEGRPPATKQKPPSRREYVRPFAIGSRVEIDDIDHEGFAGRENPPEDNDKGRPGYVVAIKQEFYDDSGVIDDEPFHGCRVRWYYIVALIGNFPRMYEQVVGPPKLVECVDFEMKPAP